MAANQAQRSRAKRPCPRLGRGKVLFSLFAAILIGRALTQRPALNAVANTLTDRRWRADG